MHRRRLNMRILLVDDIPDQLRRYRSVIKELGHEVEAVSDSVVAWHLLEQESFDALISDVQMPIFSGVELIGRMFYLEREIPTLLHSSEPRHSTGQEWIDLTEINTKFPFVTFHLKRFNVDSTSYIKPFLESVEKGK
jgi:CheY-like chemotaxis protein